MIKKIILKDFLAHSDTEIELKEGMTVLTGPNNSGKSSVVEALRCIATNPVPKHFIRHGAKKARVELEMDDSTRVAWVRKKATAWYEVLRPGEEEWEVYAKFGRKPPEDILNILRLNLVPLEGGNALDVHIGNQRNPIFLLDQPSSVAAQFFASSSEASHLLAMQTELKSRVRAAKREKKFQQQKMDSVCEELDSLQDLPEVTLDLESARELKGQLERIEREMPAIEGVLQRRKELEGYRDNLGAREKQLSGLDVPPDLYPLASLDAAVCRLNELQGYGRKLGAKSLALDGLQVPPELFPASQLEGEIGRQKQLSAAAGYYSGRSSVLSGLGTPPEVEDTAALTATISELSRNSFFKNSISRRAVVLRQLASPPDLFDSGPLMQLLVNITSLRQARSDAEQQLAATGQAEAELKERIERRLNEIGNCPLCGNELETGKLIGEGLDES